MRAPGQAWTAPPRAQGSESERVRVPSQDRMPTSFEWARVLRALLSSAMRARLTMGARAVLRTSCGRSRARLWNRRATVIGCDRSLLIRRARGRRALLHGAALAVEDVLDGAARRLAEPDGDHVLELDARARRPLERVLQHHRVVEHAVGAEAARVEAGDAGGQRERREAVLAVVGPARLRG